MTLNVTVDKASRETPLSPVDGKPLKRASLRELETLVSLAHA